MMDSFYSGKCQAPQWHCRSTRSSTHVAKHRTVFASNLHNQKAKSCVTVHLTTALVGSIQCSDTAEQLLSSHASTESMALASMNGTAYLLDPAWQHWQADNLWKT